MSAPSRIVLVVLLLLGCASPGRSTTAFCQVLSEQTQQLAAKYDARVDTLTAQDDPILGLLGITGSLLEAQGDLVNLFDRLERVAPTEIQPDVGQLRDVADQQAEAVRSGDLSEMFFGGLAGALQAGGAQSRVDAFAATNC